MTNSLSAMRFPFYALMMLMSLGLILGLAGCGGDADQPLVDEGQQETASEQDQQTQDQATTQESSNGQADSTPDQQQDEADEATDEADTTEPEDEQAEQQEASDQETGDQQDEEASESEDEVSLVERGQTVAQNTGCLACHSTDGSPMVGPTWQGAYGHEVTLANGETVMADEEYIRESIRDPDAKIVQGYPNSMPAYGESQISADELEALIAYIKSLSDEGDE